jgi:hypothetical protein
MAWHRAIDRRGHTEYQFGIKTSIDGDGVLRLSSKNERSVILRGARRRPRRGCCPAAENLRDA